MTEERRLVLFWLYERICGPQGRGWRITDSVHPEDLIGPVWHPAVMLDLYDDFWCAVEQLVGEAIERGEL